MDVNDLREVPEGIDANTSFNKYNKNTQRVINYKDRTMWPSFVFARVKAGEY